MVEDWIRDAIMGILVPALVYLFVTTSRMNVQVALNKQAIDDVREHHENELTQFRAQLDKIDGRLAALDGTLRDGMTEMRKIHTESQQNFNQQMLALSNRIFKVAAGYKGLDE